MITAAANHKEILAVNTATRRIFWVLGVLSNELEFEATTAKNREKLVFL